MADEVNARSVQVSVRSPDGEVVSTSWANAEDLVKIGWTKVNSKAKNPVNALAHAPRKTAETANTVKDPVLVDTSEEDAEDDAQLQALLAQKAEEAKMATEEREEVIITKKSRRG